MKKPKGAGGGPLVRIDPNGLYADRLFAAHRHWSEPAMAVGLLAAHDSVKLFLDRLRDGPNPALAHLDLIHSADRSDLRLGSREESFVGDVEHLARNHLLDNRD